MRISIAALMAGVCSVAVACVPASAPAATPGPGFTIRAVAGPTVFAPEHKERR